MLLPFCLITTSPPQPTKRNTMSLQSYIPETYILQWLASLSIWFLLIGIPLLTISTFCYCLARGTGNVAGVIVDTTAKRVRSYQQQQRKRDKVEPAVEGGRVYVWRKRETRENGERRLDDWATCGNSYTLTVWTMSSLILKIIFVCMCVSRSIEGWVSDKEIWKLTPCLNYFSRYLGFWDLGITYLIQGAGLIEMHWHAPAIHHEDPTYSICSRSVYKANDNLNTFISGCGGYLQMK